MGSTTTMKKNQKKVENPTKLVSLIQSFDGFISQLSILQVGTYVKGEGNIKRLFKL